MVPKELKLKCLLCNSSDFKEVLKKRVYQDEFSVLKCKNCSLHFTYPKIKPQDFRKYYSDIYQAYMPEYGRFVSFLVRNLIYRWQLVRLLKLVPRNSTVLEIGCSTGDFLYFLKKNTNWTVSGIEPGGMAASTARERGLKVTTQTIEELPTKNKYDLIIMRHVLEHLENPYESLRKLNQILKKNGVIYVVLPNVQTVERRIFAESWFAWDLPRHLFHFSPETMKLLAKNAGLKVISMKFSAIPNNLIESSKEKLVLYHKFKLAKFCTINNILLVCLFLPISMIFKYSKQSGRMAVILKR